VNTPNIDVVAHFDLVTKYQDSGYEIDTAHPNYIDAAISAVDKIILAKPNIVFEVNTGAMIRAGKSAPYPQQFILDHIVKRGARVTITTDAHDTSTLAMSTDMALDMCRRAGATVVRLRKYGWEIVK
jgi:histidinol-phosphatase (PHP family)